MRQVFTLVPADISPAWMLYALGVLLAAGTESLGISITNGGGAHRPRRRSHPGVSGTGARSAA